MITKYDHYGEIDLIEDGNLLWLEILNLQMQINNLKVYNVSLPISIKVRIYLIFLAIGEQCKTSCKCRQHRERSHCARKVFTLHRDGDPVAGKQTAMG